MAGYELFLKNQKLRSYRIIGWIVIFLNFLIILYFDTTTRYNKDLFYPSGLLFFIIVILILGRGDKHTWKDRNRYLWFAYFFAGIIWVLWKIYWMACITILLYLLYEYATRKFRITVLKEKITYPSFVIKTIKWNELSNVILKDDILTLDFKNNKLLQNEMEGDQLINEKEFNEFCSEQLRSTATPV